MSNPLPVRLFIKSLYIFVAALMLGLVPLTVTYAAIPDSHSLNATDSVPSPQIDRSGHGLPLIVASLITATKTYTLAVDDDNDNQADPGDSLIYTVVISNDGVSTATGVSFSDTLDVNTTQSGLVSVSPVAFDDSYNATANPSTLSVPNGATDLFANDYPGQNPAVGGITSFGGGSLGGAVTTNAAGSTVNFGSGGSVILRANGSFDFTPAVGFQGVFTFFYRLQNSVGPSDGLVSITVDAAPTVTGTTPTNNATSVALNTTIVVNFSESVNATTSSFTLTCGGPALSYSLSTSPANSFTLTPAANLPVNTLCTVTVVAAQITDVDANDPPDQMAANYVFSFTTVNDNAPTVTTTTPTNGATNVAIDTNITINFNESVNVTGSAVTLECPTSSPIAFSNTTTSPASSFVLNPTADLPTGVTCTVTVVATQVTDNDVIDPPDQMTANYVFSFTTDAAPSVTTTTPTNGATGVAANTNITINFSESVNVTASAFTLECPTGSSIAFSNTTTSPASSFVLDPTANLPTGVTCTVTVVATQVTDVDANDPPDQMAANYVFSFTTDAAPTVTSTTPTNGATNAAINTNITINFSESVNVTGSAFTLECPTGSSIAFNNTTTSPASSFVLNPTADLPTGVTCTVTVVATQVTDNDANDPPDQMVANYVFSFSTDAAPTVTSTTPTNGATGVAANTNITINFSESVNYSIGSFTVECPTGSSVAFTLASTSPGSSAVLNPTSDLPAGVVCTVTVLAAAITDADANDPPDQMAANYVFSFSVPPAANDDTYAPQIIGNVGINTVNSTNFSVLTNDVGAGLSITAFDATSVQGGTVVLNTGTGTFQYIPPAGYEGLDSFTYTINNVTGSDTGTVNLTVSGMIWFVDNNAGTNGDGRLGTPFNSLANFVAGAADDPGDNIFLYRQTATSYSGGVTLLNNQRLVGQGSTASLSTVTGLTVPADSLTLPATGGTNPILDTAATVITLGQNNTIRGLSVGDSTTNDISGTNFGTLTARDASLTGTGRALNLNNGTLDAVFASVTSTSGTNNINLDTITGTLTMNGGALSGATGTAFNVNGGTLSATYAGSITQSNNAALVSVSGGHNTGTLTFQTGTLNASNGTGLQFDSADGTYNFNGTTTLNGGDAGVDIINGSNGSFTFSSNTSITNPSGTAFNLNQGNGIVTYNGTASKTSAGQLVNIQSRNGGTTTLAGNLTCNTSCTGLNVANNTGGTITFSGSSKVVNTGANNAVILTSNGGATINFSGGGLDIDTTSGIGFGATGGGTVNVTGTFNTVNSTTGAAVNIATTIGASGITFRSVSANGGTNGIVLNTTGSGAFTVTGDGGGAANGSGGTIQNTTGPAVLLTSASSVSLGYMNIQNGGDDGIRGTTVTGFSLNRSLVSSNGNAAGEDGIDFNGLFGDVSITNSTVTGSRAVNMLISNASGTLNSLTITGSTFSNNNGTTDGQDGVFVTLPPGSIGVINNINVTGSTFTNNRSDGMQVNAEGTSSVGRFTFTGNTLTGNNIGVNVSTNGAASIDFDISNNPTMTGDVTQVNIAANDGLANDGVGPTMEGHIRNNVITLNPAVAGIAVWVVSEGDGIITTNIANNTITGFGDSGIDVESRGGTGDVYATITNNSATTSAAFPVAGLFLRSGNNTPGETNLLCVNATGNNMSVNTAAVAHYYMDRFSPATTIFQIQGLVGSTPANAEARMLAVNTVSGTGAGAFAEAGTYTAATCNTVSFASLLTDGPMYARTTEQPAPALTTGADLLTQLNDHTFHTTDLASTGANQALSSTPLQTLKAYSTAADRGSLSLSIMAPEPTLHSDMVRPLTPVKAGSYRPDNLVEPARFNLPPIAPAAEPLRRPMLLTSPVTIGNLPPGKVVTITFRADIAQPFPLGVTQVCNQGTVSGSNFADIVTNDPTTPAAADPTCTPIEQEADLAITKTDGRATAVPGTSTTYTITVTNNGPEPAPTSTVSDTFPAALSGITWTCSGTGGATCTAAGAGNINDTVNLPVNGVITYIASGTIDAGATGSLVNTASVSPPVGLNDPVSANNSSTDIDTLSLQADLQVTKTVDNPTPLEGETIVYTIIARNNGPSASTGVVISDVLPAGVTFDATGSSVMGGIYTYPEGTWDLMTMTAGQVATLTLSAVVDSGTTGQTITNTATITEGTNRINPANDSDQAIITINDVDLGLSKTAVHSTADDDTTTITYTLTISNPGSINATGVVVSDTLAAGLTFVSATASNGSSYNPATGLWSVGTVPAGGSVTLTLVVTANLASGESVTNVAAITAADQVDLTGSNNTASVEVTSASQRLVYLPLIMRNFSLAPNLIVSNLLATTNAVTVVIANAGSGSVVNDFWVDVYIDPSQPPQLNQTWPDIALAGLVWGVTDDLLPGQVMTLTVNGPYYRADFSNFNPLTPGTPIWAQVDSLNLATNFGNVAESDETDNIIGPISSVLSLNAADETELSPASLLETSPGAPTEGQADRPKGSSSNQLPPR